MTGGQRFQFVAAIVCSLLPLPPALAKYDCCALDEINARIGGRVVDLTNNHGCDRRIWSRALGCKRDLYVYLPPGYDGVKRFPFLMLLHGLGQDETILHEAIDRIDHDIICGVMPRAVVAVPDGSRTGKGSARDLGSFFINSDAGRFEDLIMHDVYPCVMSRFAIRPEREAHAIAGASMGGFGAYNLGMKYRQEFSILAGALPLLNLRYADCHGNRKADFHPSCIGWNCTYRPWRVAFRIHGVIPLHEGQIMGPLFRTKRQLLTQIPRENPIEMLDLYDVHPGDYHMWIGYTKNDFINADAQSEMFIHFAKQRGLGVDTHVEPCAPHNRETGIMLIRVMGPWLGQLLEPFVP